MNGFYSDIPVWSLLIWGAFVVLFSFIFYRRKSWVKEISTFNRGILIALRSLGLFLIGLLLLGLLIKGTSTDVDKPLIITLLDDSESMLNYNDSAKVKEKTLNFKNDLISQFKEKYNSLFFTLDSQLENTDSIDFKGSKTNLSKGLNSIYNNYYGRNIGALIVLSDGNFNDGTSPLIFADQFKNTPIYSLSVGDTIQKVDHLVKNVNTNEIAFLGNQFPVEVVIEGNLTQEKTFKIQLFKNDKQILETQLKHEDDVYSLIKEEFILDADQIGMHEYTVRIASLSNEYNLENNTYSFYVEVLDDRNKILLVGESLNPDIGAIRSALITEKNLEVKTATIDELPEDLQAFDLVIWHNPGVARKNQEFNKIAALKVPKWMILSPQTKSGSFSKLNLKASIKTTGQKDDVGARINTNFSLFNLSEKTQKLISTFPPLQAHYGTVKYGNNSNILAFQQVGSVTKTDPLMYFDKHQGVKFGVTFAGGLWSWRLADYQINKVHDHFDELVRKTVQYLVLKENTSRLRISLPTIASSDQDFLLNASFYNESYEPITGPNISLSLTHPNGDDFEYAFLGSGDGYQLNLGRLTAGKYKWKAAATYDGRTFEKEGTFAIKSLSIEKRATKSNHQLMRQLAENSDGNFAKLMDYQKVLDEIDQRKDIVPVAYESSTYHKLIDYVWLLLIIVGLFTAEWTLRRYLGGY